MDEWLDYFDDDVKMVEVAQIGFPRIRREYMDHIEEMSNQDLIGQVSIRVKKSCY